MRCGGMAFAQTEPHEVSTKVTRTEFFGAVTEKRGPHTGGDSTLLDSRKESRK